MPIHLVPLYLVLTRDLIVVLISGDGGYTHMLKELNDFRVKTVLFVGSLFGSKKCTRVREAGALLH